MAVGVTLGGDFPTEISNGGPRVRGAILAGGCDAVTPGEALNVTFLRRFRASQGDVAMDAQPTSVRPVGLHLVSARAIPAGCRRFRSHDEHDASAQPGNQRGCRFFALSWRPELGIPCLQLTQWAYNFLQESLAIDVTL
jgi:hypothetical protein